jgi:hypothetical protein
MRACRFFLVVPLALALGVPARAGIIFGKHANKPTPAERVPELIITVKTDKDESKREAAAEELRQYNTKDFPDIVPILIDVLLHDPKPGVRAEAAESLGKIRPVSQDAGWALEKALADDGSMRVRLQARSSLMQYHWAGYHGTKTDGPSIQTPEPPLAPLNGKAPAPAPVPARPVSQSKPVPPMKDTPPPLGARPLPSGTAEPPLIVPAEPPRLQPAPVRSGDQGPELMPPQ